MCGSKLDILDPRKGLKWVTGQIAPKPPSVAKLLEQLPAPTAPQAAATFADTGSAEATAAATLQARLRKRRAGAAANVLTSPLGIPAGTSDKLGGSGS